MRCPCTYWLDLSIFDIHRNLADLGINRDARNLSQLNPEWDDAIRATVAHVGIIEAAPIGNRYAHGRFDIESACIDTLLREADIVADKSRSPAA